MASKTKLLATNRRVLTWLCVHHPLTSNGKKLFYIIFTMFCLLMEVSGLSESIVYFTRMVAIDMHDSFYALFQIVAISGVIHMYSSAFLMRREISTFIESLNQISIASMK